MADPSPRQRLEELRARRARSQLSRPQQAGQRARLDALRAKHRRGSYSEGGRRFIGPPRAGEELKTTGEPAYADVIAGLIPAVGIARGAQLAGRTVISKLGPKLRPSVKEAIKDAAMAIVPEIAVEKLTQIPGIGGTIGAGLALYRRLKRAKDIGAVLKQARRKPPSAAPPQKTPPSPKQKQPPEGNQPHQIIWSGGARPSREMLESMIAKGDPTRAKASRLRTPFDVEFQPRTKGKPVRPMRGHLGISKYVTGVGRGYSDIEKGLLTAWEPAQLTRAARAIMKTTNVSAAREKLRQLIGSFPGEEGYRTIPLEGIKKLRPGASKGRVEHIFQ